MSVLRAVDDGVGAGAAVAQRVEGTAAVEEIVVVLAVELVDSAAAEQSVVAGLAVDLVAVVAV